MGILYVYCDDRFSPRFKPMYHHHKLNWEEIEKYKVQSNDICERLHTEIGSFDETLLIPQVRPAHKYPNSPWEMIHPPGGDNAVCM
jgi:hypothetical protein